MTSHPYSFNALRTYLIRTIHQAGLSGTGLAVIRIFTGYLWYTQLSWKTPWTAAGMKSLHGYIVKESQYAGFVPYRSFISGVILPHFTFVAYLTYFIEAALAVSLIVGLFTRLGGLLGALWATQLYLGLATAPGEWYWTYGMLVLINAVAWVAATGRWWGIDQGLRPFLQAQAKEPSRGQQVAQWLIRAT
jgi:uncharacterized membrane protein YphA (DoxX/SURF4 family)